MAGSTQVSLRFNELYLEFTGVPVERGFAVLFAEISPLRFQSNDLVFLSGELFRSNQPSLEWGSAFMLETLSGSNRVVGIVRCTFFQSILRSFCVSALFTKFCPNVLWFSTKRLTIRVPRTLS